MTENIISKLRITQDDLTVSFRLKYHGPRQGTKPVHRWFIEPKGKYAPTSNLPKALHWTENGQDFFSKGHFITGVDAKWVIREGIRQGMERYKTALREEQQQFLEATRIR